MPKANKVGETSGCIGQSSSQDIYTVFKNRKIQR